MKIIKFGFFLIQIIAEIPFKDFTRIPWVKMSLIFEYRLCRSFSRLVHMVGISSPFKRQRFQGAGAGGCYRRGILVRHQFISEARNSWASCTFNVLPNLIQGGCLLEEYDFCLIGQFVLCLYHLSQLFALKMGCSKEAHFSHDYAFCDSLSLGKQGKLSKVSTCLYHQLNVQSC